MKTVLTSLAMTLALLAQDNPAVLQSCVFEETGWVCRYRTEESAVELVPPTVAPRLPDPRPRPRPEAPLTKEETRQAKLIRRCADASWMSLCTPGDRKEARELKEAAEARATLRLRVTTLVADDRCPDAVGAALQGGDLALAREIREFCAADKVVDKPEKAAEKK
ncbi:MAG: hypothetical protein Q8J89_11665 [Caulobacter sp.]|nr:hypothetical protein [Caulobacter sp.]